MVDRVISPSHPLVLGSASPRRHELLKGLGIEHVVRPAPIGEELRPGEDAACYVERVAREKLASVQQRVGAEGHPHAAILVADTTVVVDGEILGKPSDKADALRLLGKIVGRTHQVLTRYAVAASTAGPALFARTVCSTVSLRAADREELWRYAQTGEGLDKAGAYAVQGLGAFLVRGIDGSWSNVVGLPTCELVEDLTHHGLLVDFPRLG